MLGRTAELVADWFRWCPDQSNAEMISESSVAPLASTLAELCLTLISESLPVQKLPVSCNAIFLEHEISEFGQFLKSLLSAPLPA